MPVTLLNLGFRYSGTNLMKIGELENIIASFATVFHISANARALAISFWVSGVSSVLLLLTNDLQRFLNETIQLVWYFASIATISPPANFANKSVSLSSVAILRTVHQHSRMSQLREVLSLCFHKKYIQYSH